MTKYTLKKSFINKLRKDHKDIDIAKMLDCHPSTLSLIFSGKREPSKDFILKICTKFMLFPSEFMVIKGMKKNIDK